MYDKLDRIKGCLVGLAIGDALGVHHEFKKRKDVVPISTYTDDNPYSIPKGYWTDDTSMALCMANSLIEKKEFSATDIMEKFLYGCEKVICLLQVNALILAIPPGKQSWSIGEIQCLVHIEVFQML